ncbi:regulatory protein RecX [Pelotomaculum propionicicum]|uniref:regulatory protein RecX n=1 Tax=Pelotomaculum propionicicum TaxID=258475 RepID=UPI003B81FA8A
MSSETDRARLFAYKLMTYRPRSESELRRRLECSGYLSDVVDSVMLQLTELGYIDDKAFARNWISCRSGKKGSYGLRQELLAKGIKIDVINASLAEFSPEDELCSALKIAEKKITQCGGSCPYPRLAGFLKRRGFSYTVINSVCATLGTGCDSSVQP